MSVGRGLRLGVGFTLGVAVSLLMLGLVVWLSANYGPFAWYASANRESAAVRALTHGIHQYESTDKIEVMHRVVAEYGDTVVIQKFLREHPEFAPAKE